VEAILAAFLATSLAGCVVRGTPKTAAVPPAPQPPENATASPAPPPALSIPQTQVQLPPPQPVNLEALSAVASPEPAVEPATAAPAGRGGRGGRGASTTAAPKPETPASVTPPPPPPAVEARAPIQEIVPASEQKRLQESAQARRKEILQWIDGTGRRRANRHPQTVILIRSFLKDSDAAEKRGDMRQADALAERAQILLRELQNGQ